MKTDFVSARSLERFGLEVLVDNAGRDGSVVVSFDSPTLGGPIGFRVLVWEMEHTYRLEVEFGNLAAPLVRAVLSKIVNGPAILSKLEAQVEIFRGRLEVEVDGHEITDESLVSEDEKRIIARLMSRAIAPKLSIGVAGAMRPQGDFGFAHAHEFIVEDLVLDLLGALVDILEIEVARPSKTFLFEALPEGASVSVLANRYERDPRNRENCIQYYGYGCQICGFDFESAYGELGHQFIEVHHTNPLATQGGVEAAVDPIRDLIPLCSNCHSMIHRGGKILSPQEIMVRLGREE